MRTMMFPTGFFWAALLLLGVIGFGTASIDQSVVQRMAVVGDLNEPQLADIKQLLGDLEIAANEADELKQRLSEVDWIAHVNIRKNWPGEIEIEVFPESVIAYWNDDGFINQEGKVLVTELLTAGDLPHLYGPDGSAFEVMEQYQELGLLLGVSGHEIQVLTVSERGSWSLETEADIEVLLGKEDLKSRLERFLAVSQSLKNQGDDRNIERMDARYINGVAVHFETENEIKLAESNKRLGELSL